MTGRVAEAHYALSTCSPTFASGAAERIAKGTPPQAVAADSRRTCCYRITLAGRNAAVGSIPHICINLVDHLPQSIGPSPLQDLHRCLAVERC